MPKTLKVLTVGLILIIGMSLFEFVNIKSAKAINYSNLISDSEFVNWGTLDATGVQQFLNAHGGTRLRGFSEGGRSAAQIIADSARSNGLNPFVILATIQKEESLVDSNTNFDYRVNWAMGYGICDSCSPDDPDIQKYYGFTKQIDNGAWQLKRNYSYWASNGSDWNVGKTMNIDGLNVRFSNRATSALFRYTPHLPGNENFVNIYNRYKTFRGSAKFNTKGSSVKSKVSKTKSSISGDVTYGAQTYRQAGITSLRPGQKVIYNVYMKNTGTAIWNNSGDNQVYLGNSSPQDRGSAFMGGQNIRWQLLSRSVSSDKIGVFSIELTAPSTPGTYVEKFRPVKEGVAWFGDEITFTFNVSGSPAAIKKK